MVNQKMRHMALCGSYVANVLLFMNHDSRISDIIIYKIENYNKPQLNYYIFSGSS